jgi:hypothetical protein
MKVLTVGCSFADGDQSWAKIITDFFPGSDRVAFPAVGNRWISSIVQDYTIKKKYDLVLVMWTGYTRLDVPTAWIDRRLEKYEFCPSRKSFVESSFDWISSGSLNGSWSGSKDPAVKSLFENIYLEIDHEIAAYMTLSDIISSQSLLKCQGIPYYFMTYVNYWSQARPNSDLNSWYYDTDLSIDRFSNLDHLKNHIDWNCWIFDQGTNGIYERCMSSDDLAEDDLHPGVEIHKSWADKILDRIKN